MSGREVVERARDGDEDALGLLHALGRHLGVGMAGVINTFEPEAARDRRRALARG